MTRSRKKTPKTWVCHCRQKIMKKWKTNISRRFRRSFTYLDIPNGNVYKKISGDLWLSPSDGKMYFEPEKNDRFLRK